MNDVSGEHDPISPEEAEPDEYDPKLDGDNSKLAGSQPTGKL
jgi:hypothetical protein